MNRRPHCGAMLQRGLAALGLLLVSGAVLTACASAPTHFFTLDPVAPAQPLAAAYAGPPVKVVAVNIPPNLDREELVSETGPGQVKVHDLEHWEAPLGLTARQVLVQDLAGRLPVGAVLGPASPGGDGVAVLSVDIVSFRAGAEGAQMQASWSVNLPGGVGLQVFRSPLVTLQAPGVSGEGAGTAQAFSALLAQVSDQIAVGLPAQMQALTTARALAAPRMQTTTQTTQTQTTRRF